MEAITTYRNGAIAFSDSDSNDSDSDGDWKRNRHTEPIVQDSSQVVPPSLPSSSPVIQSVPDVSNNAKKRKINKIWSSVLEEQTVTDVFTQCQLKPKPISMVDRSCESYDFRRKLLDNREEIFPDEADMDTNNEEKIDEKQETNVHCKKKSKFPRLKPEDVQVAKKIIYKLNEKKRYLIYRIVHVVGAEKAMELLKMTEDVEDNGGMLIKNNSRRRTPGGVYIQLLKSDKHLTKVQIDEIFAEEEPFIFRKGRKSGGRKKKKGNNNRKQAAIFSMDVVDAPPPTTTTTDSNISPVDSDASPVSSPEVAPATNTEAVIETDDSEIEDGEILDDDD